jgi:hypothetical protein
MTFVILSGGIDLSVGSIVALSGVVLGASLKSDQPMLVGVIVASLVGLACGPGQRRAGQLGRPAAVHRHARHHEHRPRRALLSPKAGRCPASTRLFARWPPAAPVSSRRR